MPATGESSGKVADMLLRRLARPMLASTFIIDGIQGLRDTAARVEAGGPELTAAVDRLRDILPDGIPVDAPTLVRVDALVKIVAGALLALGRAPRVAALALAGGLVPATAISHSFWSAKDDQERLRQLGLFLKDASVLGGLLIASADTEGKPSWGWRARHAATQAGHQLQHTAESTLDTLDTARNKLPL
jgi:putative oxidoreductase